MRLAKKWMTMVLSIASFAVAAAQTGAELSGVVADSISGRGTVLPLEEAIAIALEKNLQLQAAQRGASAASWGVKRAYTAFLPSVNINFNYLRLDAGTVDRANIFTDIGRALVRQFAPEEDPNKIRPAAWRDSYGPAVNATQPLFTGGALLASLNVAQAQDMTSQAHLANTAQDVILNTQKAYYEVLKAQELVAVAKDFLRSAEEHLNSARKKVEAGLRSRAEVLRWEVEKANAESNMVRAENALAMARPALNQVLGLDLNATYTLVPVQDVEVEIPATVEEQVELALRKHPGLREMQANVEIVGAEVKLARSNFTPKVSLVYDYRWEANNTIKLDSYHTWTLGLVAQFPIFNSFRDYTELRRTQESKKQMEHLQHDYERGLRLQVLQASLNLDAAQKQMVISEKARAEAEENLRVVKNSYEVGLASNLDFLDAQNAKEQARWNFINARYDFLLATSALARAMGVLGR